MITGQQMKKIMLIGGSKTGKSTLIKVLQGKGYSKNDKRTQTLQYSPITIDTPGEYLENKNYNTALISAAVDADLIGLVIDATAEQSFIPPGFASIFAKEVIGIITKVDIKNSDINKARDMLWQSGVSSIIQTSSREGTGIDELRRYLKI